MIEAYSKNLTLASGDAIPFNAISLIKGDTVQHRGTTTFELNRCGIYAVDFDIAGLPAAAGAFQVEMTKDGVAQPQAGIEIPAALTNVGIAASKPTLVQVGRNNGCACCASPVILQFFLRGVGLTNADPHIRITKVC